MTNFTGNFLETFYSIIPTPWIFFRISSKVHFLVYYQLLLLLLLSIFWAKLSKKDFHFVSVINFLTCRKHFSLSNFISGCKPRFSVNAFKKYSSVSFFFNLIATMSKCLIVYIIIWGVKNFRTVMHGQAASLLKNQVLLN